MQTKSSAHPIVGDSPREFSRSTSIAFRPQLVADIGGTNARFGLIEHAGARVTNVAVMRCADFATPADAALAYLADQRVANIPTVAAFALAVAIDDGPLKLTNGSWIFKRDELRVALGLEQLKFLNDFEALAFGLPDLMPGDYTEICGGSRAGVHTAKFSRDHLIAVIGPGTGLGVGAITPSAHGWIAVPAEGGHVTLAAYDDFESELLRVARQLWPHVSAERFLSGLGLPFLYRTVATVRGEKANASANSSYEAHDIVREAIDNADPLCVATLDVFCAMLGSFAGNAALTLGAQGGVFIGGGVVPKLGDFFLQSKFRERFVAKGRYRTYLEKVATALIISTDVALNGAAKSLAQTS